MDRLGTHRLWISSTNKKLCAGSGLGRELNSRNNKLFRGFQALGVKAEIAKRGCPCRITTEFANRANFHSGMGSPSPGVGKYLVTDASAMDADPYP